MMLVVDASALIALATCGCLPLVDRLFGTVLVSEQVFIELTTDAKPMLCVQPYWISQVSLSMATDHTVDASVGIARLLRREKVYAYRCGWLRLLAPSPAGGRLGWGACWRAANATKQALTGG